MKISVPGMGYHPKSYYSRSTQCPFINTTEHYLVLDCQDTIAEDTTHFGFKTYREIKYSLMTSFHSARKYLSRSLGEIK